MGGALYALGWWRLRRPSGERQVLPAWRAWCFAVGLVTLWVALLSPIDEFTELLFSAHMVQHLLLVEVAAPLLLLGAPLLPMLWALPRDLRVVLGSLFGPDVRTRQIFDLLTHPLVAESLYVAALSVWHLPVFYDEAQGRTAVHDMEHMVFLGTALLFWWPIIHPAGGKRRLSYAAAIPYLLPPMLVGSLIGALLTFAQHPLYSTYQQVPRMWGITVVQDQQLAGLIMWVPGGMAYLIPILLLVALHVRQEDRLADARLGNGAEGSGV